MAEQRTPFERQTDRLLPDQVTMGLLAYLTAHAVDEDYAEVAARRADAGSGAGPGEQAAPTHRRIGVAGAVVLAVFAILTATAAVQTSQNSVSEERERRALIEQVQGRKTAVEADRKRLAKLRTQTSTLEAQLVRNSRDSSALLTQLDLLRMRSGISPVHGPGVEIVVDDAKDAEDDRNRVLDIDLQKIVNGLWRAGAEAISINGQRLTVLSAIRHGGRGITVNFQGLSRPYRILAIGDPKTLPSQFVDTASGQAWLDQQREFGLRFSMHTQSSLRLPAAELPTLRFAQGPGTAQGKRSS